MDFMISLFGSEQTGQPRQRKKIRSSGSMEGSILTPKEELADYSVTEEFPPEVEEGNVEYKLKLVDPSPSRFEHLVTQMKWRLREGQGEAIYEIGVEDNGILAGLSDREMDSSISTLRRMANQLGASVTLLRERDVDEEGCATRKRVAELLVRKVPESQQFIDLRVAVLGCADAGKSTLLGVLTQGELDNGRGKSRLNLFRHLHEIQTGRTSSISLDVLGFGPEGEPINHQEHIIEEILEKSSKLVTFIDLAGHQKYLKQTIFGLTGYRPHYAMLVVSANLGMIGTSREHLGIAIALEVPIFVVVTKVDLVTPNGLARTLLSLEAILKGPGCKRIPFRIENEDDALNTAANFTVEQIVPIFVLSSVTGENMDLLLRFLNVLPPNVQDRLVIQEHFEFQIDEVFNVQSVGVVAAGLVSKGLVREGDSVLVGPSITGEFYPVCVESLHRNKAACRIVQAGQAASVALGDLKDIAVRKGMGLVSQRLDPKATFIFEAKVYILYHPSAYICQGFQTTVHIGNVCQTATIVSIIDKSCLRSNESATVRFKFLRQPEYLREGSRLLFREGKTKGIGHVTTILYEDS